MKPAEGFEFRRATPADVPAIILCWSADPSNPPADSRITAYFDERHHPQQALLPRAGYLALHGENVIGYIAGHLTTRNGCEGEIQYFFVAPAFRRRGVGTGLLQLLAQWFRDHVAKHICVPIAGDSAPEARPFFEKMGAVPLRKNWYEWRA